MKNIMTAVIFALLILFNLAQAQITRQELSSQKVVYTFDPKDCAQTICVNPIVGNPGSHSDYYWAIVPIPELVLSNAPIIEVRHFDDGIYGPGPIAPPGWSPRDNAIRGGVGFGIRYNDGVAYLLWKCVFVNQGIASTNFSGQLNGGLTQIIVINHIPIAANVTNSGTGNTLKVAWTPDIATSNKISGYKVYRRTVGTNQ